MALATASSAMATPPACLLACVAKVNLADQKCDSLNKINCICTNEYDSVISCLSDVCPNGNSDTAAEAFKEICGGSSSDASSILSAATAVKVNTVYKTATEDELYTYTTETVSTCPVNGPITKTITKTATCTSPICSIPVSVETISATAEKDTTLYLTATKNQIVTYTVATCPGNGAETSTITKTATCTSSVCSIPTAVESSPVTSTEEDTTLYLTATKNQIVTYTVVTCPGNGAETSTLTKTATCASSVCSIPTAVHTSPVSSVEKDTTVHITATKNQIVTVTKVVPCDQSGKIVTASSPSGSNVVKSLTTLTDTVTCTESKCVIPVTSLASTATGSSPAVSSTTGSSPSGTTGSSCNGADCITSTSSSPAVNTKTSEKDTTVHITASKNQVISVERVVPCTQTSVTGTSPAGSVQSFTTVTAVITCTESKCVVPATSTITVTKATGSSPAGTTGSCNGSDCVKSTGSTPAEGTASKPTGSSPAGTTGSCNGSDCVKSTGSSPAGSSSTESSSCNGVSCPSVTSAEASCSGGVLCPTPVNSESTLVTASATLSCGSSSCGGLTSNSTGNSSNSTIPTQFSNGSNAMTVSLSLMLGAFIVLAL